MEKGREGGGGVVVVELSGSGEHLESRRREFRYWSLWNMTWRNINSEDQSTNANTQMCKADL